MTITKKDFKELAEIYDRAWEAYFKLSDYYNSDIIGEALFKGVEWIKLKARISEKDSDFDIFDEWRDFHSVGINYRQDENGEWFCEQTDDLDKIYEYHLGKEPEATMFTSSKEAKEFDELRDEIWNDFRELEKYYNAEVFENVMLEAIGWLGMKVDDMYSGIEDFEDFSFKANIKHDTFVWRT